MTTTPRGITLGEWGRPTEILTWTQIQAVAARVPSDVRMAIADTQRSLEQHRASYPRSRPPTLAAAAQPPTAEALAAWRITLDELQRRLRLLLDQALALAAEAADLFDLLAEREAQGPAVPVRDLAGHPSAVPSAGKVPAKAPARATIR